MRKTALSILTFWNAAERLQTWRPSVNGRYILPSQVLSFGTRPTTFTNCATARKTLPYGIPTFVKDSRKCRAGSRAESPQPRRRTGSFSKVLGRVANPVEPFDFLLIQNHLLATSLRGPRERSGKEPGLPDGFTESAPEVFDWVHKTSLPTGQRLGSLGAGGTGRTVVLPAVDRFYERVSPEPVRSLPRFKLELRVQHQVTGADQFVKLQAAQAGGFIRWHRSLWRFAGLTIQVGSRDGSRAGGGV